MQYRHKDTYMQLQFCSFSVVNIGTAWPSNTKLQLTQMKHKRVVTYYDDFIHVSHEDIHIIINKESYIKSIYNSIHACYTTIRDNDPFTLAGSSINSGSGGQAYTIKTHFLTQTQQRLTIYNIVSFLRIQKPISSSFCLRKVRFMLISLLINDMVNYNMQIVHCNFIHKGIFTKVAENFLCKLIQLCLNRDMWMMMQDKNWW